MVLSVYFDNVVVYDIPGRMDVVKGQTFKVVLGDYAGEKVFANSDPILQINHTPGVQEFEVITKEIGISEIQIQSVDRATVRFLTINVIDQVEFPAVNLGLTAGTAEPK